MSLESPTPVQRAWMTKYVCSTAPSWSTNMMTAKQFKKTGSVIHLHAKEKVLEKPSLSIRKANQIAEISCSLARSI